MRGTRRKGLAVGLAVLLALSNLTALAQESHGTEIAGGLDVTQTMSGDDLLSEPGTGQTVSGGNAQKEETQTVSGSDAQPETNQTASGGSVWLEDEKAVSDGDLQPRDGQTVSDNDTQPGSGKISGQDGDIFWEIDELSGKLTVTGTGDLSPRTFASEDFAWWPYRSKITSAEIHIDGMTDASYLFYGCENMTSLDLSGLDTSNVTNMRYMFSGCSSLTSMNTSGLDTLSVTDMRGMFSGCRNLTSLDLSSLDTSSVTDMGSMFHGCTHLTSLDLSGLDTSGVTNMGNMFYDCSSLAALDLSGFDTSGVTNISFMFFGCSGLTSLDLSGLDTSSVTDMLGMTGMFCGCSSLTSLDLSSLDTSSVTSMWGMFEGCSGLTNLDLSDLDTSSVADMNSMFNGCSGLTSLDLSGLDTSSVEFMAGMFENCSGLTSLDLSGLDISSVKNMSYIFRGCSSLTSLNLSGLDTSNVTVMTGMFIGCSGLTKIYTPYHVNVQSILPSSADMGPWQFDGTDVTELPQGLDHSVILTRSAVEKPPQIITTTPDLNMEDVVRVKYVPYSYTVRTDNTDPENTVTFSIVEGRLAEGLQMYPATGEIYGVPLEAGEFKIKVMASYSNPAYESSYAELMLIVLDNTDSNVGTATDDGYEITQPVVDFNMDAVSGEGTQTLVSRGEYSLFKDVFIDGEKLVKGQDYTSEAGSTRITILNQTLSKHGRGTHTLGVEFRTEEGVLKRAAQNYSITADIGDMPSDEGNIESGNNGSSNEENHTPADNTPLNSGSDTGLPKDDADRPIFDAIPSGDGSNISNIPSIPPVTVQEETPQQEFVIYTVVRGDNLWKIAAKCYGRGEMWKRIYEDNRMIIKNPKRIYAGQKLRIRLAWMTQNNVPVTSEANAVPALPVPGEAAAGDAAYRVKKGDSLWSIAQSAYGSGRYWTLLYDANRHIVADPGRLRVGMELIIPRL